MWCAQSATRLTAESKRIGPDPGNGIFGEKLFLFFSPPVASVSQGCKWMEKHPLLKVSTGSDLHCIIQIAVKCIICSNCMVQCRVSVVHFQIHVCHFFSFLSLSLFLFFEETNTSRITRMNNGILLLYVCKNCFMVLLHFTREWRGGKKNTRIVHFKRCSNVSMCTSFWVRLRLEGKTQRACVRPWSSSSELIPST